MISGNIKLNAGDYVLATKWHDGDPQDQWCVGFYDATLEKSGGDRYMVVDAEGNQFSGNGFRRVKKISADRGSWILQHKKEIESSGLSLWGWVRLPMRNTT
jgi:hypothetical protein